MKDRPPDDASWLFLVLLCATYWIMIRLAAMKPICTATEAAAASASSGHPPGA